MPKKKEVRILHLFSTKPQEKIASYTKNIYENICSVVKKIKTIFAACEKT